jgi:hypothetical protein
LSRSIHGDVAGPWLHVPFANIPEFQKKEKSPDCLRKFGVFMGLETGGVGKVVKKKWLAIESSKQKT